MVDRDAPLTGTAQWIVQRTAHRDAPADLIDAGDEMLEENTRLRGLIRQATEYVEADGLVMGGTAEHAILLDAMRQVNKGE